jgi:hypothetical protein
MTNRSVNELILFHFPLGLQCGFERLASRNQNKGNIKIPWVGEVPRGKEVLLSQLPEGQDTGSVCHDCYKL